MVLTCLIILVVVVCFAIGALCTYLFRLNAKNNVQLGLNYLRFKFETLSNNGIPFILEVSINIVIDQWKYKFGAQSEYKCKEKIKEIIIGETRRISSYNCRGFWLTDQSKKELRISVQKRFYDYYNFELYKFPYLLMITDIDVNYIPLYSRR